MKKKCITKCGFEIDVCYYKYIRLVLAQVNLYHYLYIECFCNAYRTYYFVYSMLLRLTVSTESIDYGVYGS